MRLACLLALASVGPPDVRDDVARQLADWEEAAKLFPGRASSGKLLIHSERLRVLRLLGGDVAGALDGLQRQMGVDWKRYLGLLMWYQASQAASLGSVFARLEQQVEGGQASWPAPWYVEGRRAGTGEGLGFNREAKLGGAEDGDGGRKQERDLLYLLMLLKAQEESEEGSGKGGGIEGEGSGLKGKSEEEMRELLSAMLSWPSWCQDPLDARLTWHLQSVLQVSSCDSQPDSLFTKLSSSPSPPSGSWSPCILSSSMPPSP